MCLSTEDAVRQNRNSRSLSDGSLRYLSVLEKVTVLGANLIKHGHVLCDLDPRYIQPILLHLEMLGLACKGAKTTAKVDE